MRTILTDILVFCAAQQCSIMATYLPGDQNYVADYISRLNMGDGYQLNPKVFKIICNISLFPTIDRFASKNNALLPVYNSFF